MNQIPRHPECNETIRVIIEKLCEKFNGLIAVYLHGSIAKKKGRPGSDLDLALLFVHDKRPSAKEIFIMRPELEEIAVRTVDLSILSTENSVFAKEVISNGVRVFCSDDGACEQFEMYVYSFYGKLNDERRQILESYQSDSETALL